MFLNTMSLALNSNKKKNPEARIHNTYVYIAQWKGKNLRATQF